MKIRSALLTIVFAFALALSGVKAAKRAGASGDPPVGPYTEIRLPLEDLPQPNQDLVHNPQIDQPYSETRVVREYSEENDYYFRWRETEYFEKGATLQILYVLKDPREVPKARFAYNSTASDGVVPPNNYVPNTINVYVRVQAPEDESVHDPVFADYVQDLPLGSTPALYVSGGHPTGEPDTGYPDLVSCAMPEYANGTQPYQLPGDIEGGEAVNQDGLYDPKAYAPPRPWYYGKNPLLEPGEVREGWISCMAPDVPLEDLLVYASYWYTPEPEFQRAGSTFQWISATEEYGYDPDFSALEPIGFEASDLPKSMDECEASEHCLTLERQETILSLEYWEECRKKAKEAEMETGMCSFLEAPGLPNELFNTMVFYTETFEEAERESQLVWAYSKAGPFPNEGIRIDHIGLQYHNEEGEQKTVQGSVTLQNTNIIRFTDQHPTRPNSRFLFISKIAAVPEVDMQGFTLSGLDAYIEVFDESNAPGSTFWSSRRGLIEVNGRFATGEEESQTEPINDLFLYQTDSPTEGYIFEVLSYDSDSRGYMHYMDNPLPSPVWFNVIRDREKSRMYERRYPATADNVVNNPEPSTNMCEFVDCLDVQDPDDPHQQLRTVPMLCPGEWANNFTIDGLSIEDIEYLGEPHGLTSFPNYLYRYSRFYEKRVRTWVYGGRIMGGLTPWWFTYHGIWGYRIATLEGKIVDKNTGQYVDSEPRILPYYYKEDGAYYLPVDESQHRKGWMSGIISEKMLIYGLVDDESYSKENTVYLFQEEGPAWSTECSRSPLPTLTSADSYAPNHATDNVGFESTPHIMTELMPGMTYPVSQPRITGKVLSLGEEGGTIFGQVLKPVEVKIIPGKTDKPVVYVPKEDAFYPALERVSDNNEAFFRRVDAQLIPPDSSLVMVKTVKVPPGGPIKCEEINNGNLQLSYPHYYPTTSQPGSLRIQGQFLSLCPKDFSEEWIIFRFPSLAIDREKLTFSIRGEENWIFWSLAERQEEE